MDKSLFVEEKLEIVYKTCFFFLKQYVNQNLLLKRASD